MAAINGARSSVVAIGAAGREEEGRRGGAGRMRRGEWRPEVGSAMEAHGHCCCPLGKKANREEKLS